MNNEQKNDVSPIYAQAILVYALFLIIFSHIFGSYCQNLDAHGRAMWWVANALDTFTRPGVPLFFMITGFLLLDPSISDSWSMTLKKTVVKVLIPLAAWSVLYGLWFAFLQQAPFSLKTTVVKMLQEPIAYHLWFIYYLAGLSLAAPILRIYIRNIRTQTERGYFVALWIFSVCVPFFFQRFFSINFGDWLVVTTGYVGYFVTGQFQREVRLNGALKRTTFPLMVLLYAAGAAATYHLTRRNGGNLDEFFYLDKSPNLIAVSVLTFLWMKSLPYEKFFERFSGIKTALNRLSGWSFGVYFVHLMVYEALRSGCLGFHLDEHTYNPAAGIFLTTLVTLIVGAAITACLQKIPIIRWIVPGDWCGLLTDTKRTEAFLAERPPAGDYLTSAKLW
jgi:surface polysaccharide O-acyltransferase-like enzyme